MTDYIKAALELLHIGDNVKIRFGTEQDQESAEGTLTAVNNEFIRLTDPSEAVSLILTEDIRYIRTTRNTSHADMRETAIYEQSDTDEIEDNPKEVHEESPVEDYTFPEDVFSYSADVYTDEIKANLNIFEGAEKNILSGIFESFRQAKKSNSLDYKHQEIRSKLIEVLKKCIYAEEKNTVYLFLGINAIEAGEYRLAAEPLVRCERFSLAAYAAQKAEEEKTAYIFKICSLLSMETTDITSDIKEGILRYNDVKAVTGLLDIYAGVDEMCDGLCIIARELCEKNGLDTKTDKDTSSYSKVVKYADRLKACEAKESAVDYMYSFMEIASKDNDENGFDDTGTGIIASFAEAGTGFIAESEEKRYDRESSTFFYIKQVDNKTEKGRLLRYLLHAQDFFGLSVEYRNGLNPKRHNRAATCVMLTDEGFADALARIAPKSGVITKFDVSANKGCIQYKNTFYTFGTEDIKDPYLNAFFKNTYTFREQNVYFKCTGTFAYDIEWQNPSESDLLAYRSCITDSDIADWDEYLKNKDQLVFDDPYEGYGYEELEPYTENVPATSRMPLTWGTALPGEKNQDATKEDAAVSAESMPRGISLDKLLNRISILLEEKNGSAAEKLLEEGKDIIPRYDYITLSAKANEFLSDKQKLCELYEEILGFDKQITATKRAYFLNRLILAYMSTSQFGKALDACDKWCELYESIKGTDAAVKFGSFEANIQKDIAICKYNLGDTEEAKALAAELLKKLPHDYDLRKIVEDKQLEAEATEKQTEPSDPDLFPDEGDYAFRIPPELLSGYVRNAIANTNLSSMLTDRVTNGEYTGTPEDASIDITRLVNRACRKQADESALFAAIKLIERFEKISPVRSPEYKLRLLGRAMLLRGDAVSAASPDTSRMLYKYAVRAHAADREKAIARYVNLLLLSSDEFAAYIKTEQHADELFADVVTTDKEKHGFVIGILELVHALSCDEPRRRALLNELYSQNVAIKSVLCDALSNITTLDTVAVTFESFCKCIVDAGNIIADKKSDLCFECKLLSSSISQGDSKIDTSAVAPEKWEKFLFDADLQRLTDVYVLAEAVRSGENSADNAARAAELIRKATNSPTELSEGGILALAECILRRL